MIENIIITASLLTGVLFSYCYWLFLKVVNKIEKGNSNNILILLTRRIFIPVKFNLPKEYPDKEVLQLSRKYDKTITKFYVVIGAWIVFIFVDIFIKKL